MCVLCMVHSTCYAYEYESENTQHTSIHTCSYTTYIIHIQITVYTTDLKVREQGRDEVVHRMSKMAEKSGSGQGLRTHVPQSLQGVCDQLDLKRGGCIWEVYDKM